MKSERIFFTHIRLRGKSWKKALAGHWQRDKERKMCFFVCSILLLHLISRDCTVWRANTESALVIQRLVSQPNHLRLHLPPFLPAEIWGKPNLKLLLHHIFSSQQIPQHLHYFTSWLESSPMTNALLLINSLFEPAQKRSELYCWGSKGNG